MSPPRSSTPPLARDQWARLRFAVIGPLLASPPEPGKLLDALKLLAGRDWQHPITGLPTRFGVSTIERWYYQARRQRDPVGALKPKLRADAGRSRALSGALKLVIAEQYQAHRCWSVQLHYDNLAARVADDPALGPLPSYATVRRHFKACGLIAHKRQSRRDYRRGRAGRPNDWNAAKCAASRSTMSTACGTWTSTTVRARYWVPMASGASRCCWPSSMTAHA